MNAGKACFGSVMLREPCATDIRITSKTQYPAIGVSVAAPVKYSALTLSEAISQTKNSSLQLEPTKVAVLKHSDINSELDLARYTDTIKAAQHQDDFFLRFDPQDDVVTRGVVRLTNNTAAATGISAPDLLGTAAGALLGPLKLGLMAAGTLKGSTTAVARLANMKKKVQRYTERYDSKYQKAAQRTIDDPSMSRDQKIKWFEFHIEQQYELIERYESTGPKYKARAAAVVYEKLLHGMGAVLDQKKK